MKYLSLALLALALVGCNEMKTVDIVGNVKNGTVLIENKIDATNGGIGTGFIIAENMIITNHHVIDGKGELVVISPVNSRKYKAEVVYSDSIVDLAILKLTEWDNFVVNENPVELTLGDSDDMPEGSKVVVIGHPWGLTWTVSEGIVSAKNRRPGSSPKFVDQIDAKIFQGNSGGPIFNEYGQVVCVSELMLEGKGGSYGFCIPSNLVKKVIYDFETMNEVRWRALNVSIGLTEDSSSVKIESLVAGGAADKAGLLVGDILLEVYTSTNHPQGKRITDANDLITELAGMRGDEEKMKLLIERNGEKMLLDVNTSYKISTEFEPDKTK